VWRRRLATLRLVLLVALPLLLQHLRQWTSEQTRRR
jgi:hypothetical protein